MTVYKTSLKPKDMNSNLNAMKYVIDREIKNMVNTLLVVKVIAVYNETIDVQTILKDLSDNGQLVDTYTISSVRYVQWQYGQNAIVAKPKVGDVGLLLISKQDISGLTKGAISVCQTNSSYNIGDGIYLGGLFGMNELPTQTLEFDTDSIKVTGTGTLNLETSGDITITSSGGNLTINATTATVNASMVNLGGSGGKPVARQGDNVVSGTTVIGQIQAGSSKVMAVD